MITIKNKQAIEKMSVAGKLLSELFHQLGDVIVPGISTLSIDQYIDQYQKKNNILSSSRGYMGYKHVSCISVNDEIVHGVPRADRIIREGDLVKVDVCGSWKGYCADMARCYFVGTVADDVKKFIEIAQVSLDKGIAAAQVGRRLTDISFAIQSEVEKHGYGIVKDFAGHGIGKRMHEDPEILNYGSPGRGPVIQVGMAFAIEPMITMGDWRVAIDKDGWTARTADKSLAAHVEDTIVITEDGPRIITR